MTSLSHRASTFAQAFTSSNIAAAAKATGRYVVNVAATLLIVAYVVAIGLIVLQLGEAMPGGVMALLAAVGLILAYLGGREALDVLGRIADEMATANARTRNHESNGAADVARANGEARAEAAA
jgi:hypothetical protein